MSDTNLSLLKLEKNGDKLTDEQWWFAYKEFGKGIQLAIEESPDPETKRKNNDLYLRWLDMGARATGIMKPGETNNNTLIVAVTEKAVEAIERAQRKFVN